MRVTSPFRSNLVSSPLPAASMIQAPHVMRGQPFIATVSTVQAAHSHVCSVFGRFTCLQAPCNFSQHVPTCSTTEFWRNHNMTRNIWAGILQRTPSLPSGSLLVHSAAPGSGEEATDLSSSSAAPSEEEAAASTAEAKPAKRKRKRKEKVDNEQQAPLPGPEETGIIEAAADSGSSSNSSSSSSSLDRVVAFDPQSLFQDLPSSSGPWMGPSTWVMFSDLHVHPRTLATCLQVLRQVHIEAAQRNAGILFLGDFWDERGALPVPTLNAILSELEQWTQPMLMLVGNHDQVDLGGAMHSLTPLQMAFSARLHVFSSPALFRGALWLPYRRDHRLMRAAMDAAMQAAPPGSVTAVFAHADVQTARYNHAVQARDGIDPALFPPGLPVYSGHYHLPQQVANTSIMYVGSPYQVTAAEAGESKRLLVLNADEGWRIVEEVKIELGPRHIRAGSLQELQSLAAAAELDPSPSLQPGADGGGGTVVKAGDKIKCSIPAGEELGQYEEVQRSLRQRGVKVELVQRSAVRAPRIMEAEDKGVLLLLEEYARAEGMDAEAERAARDALGEELVRGGTAGGSDASRRTDICFGRMEVEGFGPFRDRQEYMLADRGVRVITGLNKDDACAESNGAGKTSLVAAPLWALTGDMLARTESGSGRMAVDSMLNDTSKEGWVRLEGSVNEEAFVVERSVRKGKTARLHFELGGVDMDQQDLRDTQALLSQHFNQQLLRHAVFYGQNDITAILEADDARFKELLGKVVEMDIWEKAQGRVRAERSERTREAATVEGRLAAWEQQVGPATLALEGAGEQQRQWQEQQEAKELAVAQELAGVEDSAAALVRPLAAAHQELLHGHQQVVGWAQEAEVAARALEVAAAGSEELLPMPVVPLPGALQELQVEVEGTGEGGAEGSSGSSEGGGWMLEMTAKHAEQDEQHQQLWKEREAAVEGESREVQRAAAAALAAAEPALLAARAAASELKARLDLSSKQLQRARRSLPAGPEGGGARSSGHEQHEALAQAGAGAVQAEHERSARLSTLPYEPAVSNGSGGAVAGASLQVAVQRVCDHCLQEIDPHMFLAKLRQLEAEHEQLEGEYAAAELELHRREAAWGEAGRAQGLEEERCRQQLERLKVDMRRDGEQLRQAQRAELEEREAAARAQAGAARAQRERRRAEAQAARAEAMRAYTEERRRVQAEWEARRMEVHAQTQRRLALLQDTRAHHAKLLAIAQRAQDAARAVEAVRSRWPLAAEHWGDAGSSSDAGGSERLRVAEGRAPVPAPAQEEQQRRMEQLEQVAVGATGSAARVDALQQQLQLLRSQRQAVRQETNPYAQTLHTLQLQLEELGQRIEEERQRQAQCKRRVYVLDQADKALGRGGIPSFVLEGVLGELQIRTDYYLEQLSDTMVLELSATKPTGSKATTSSQANAEPGQKARSRARRGAAVAAVEEGTDGDSSAKGGRAKKGGGDTGSGDKEEIHKVVKVKVGNQLLPRSLAQLSGGERRRVALALALGFAELVRTRGRLSSNILILDEVLQQLDAEGCAKVAMMLKGLPHESVLVVGQAHSFVTRAFDLVDTVVKQHGSSRLQD